MDKTKVHDPWSHRKWVLTGVLASHLKGWFRVRMGPPPSLSRSKSLEINLTEDLWRALFPILWEHVLTFKEFELKILVGD